MRGLARQDNLYSCLAKEIIRILRSCKIGNSECNARGNVVSFHKTCGPYGIGTHKENVEKHMNANVSNSDSYVCM